MVDPKTTLILKPSGFHGVGVFALHKIKKGAKVSLWHPRDYKFRKTCSRAEQRYCIKNKKGWHDPLDFHRMSIGGISITRSSQSSACRITAQYRTSGQVRN